MKSFLKFTLATITGIIVSSILFSILIIGILGAMMATADKPVSINSNSVLKLRINQPIQDRSSQNPFNIDFLTMEFTPRLGLNDILNSLEKAKDDPKIKGIFLESGFLSPGIATLEEIREALLDFKTSGKFIVAYANEFMPQSFYYLATVADKIYLNPVAIFEFLGLRSEVMYYKDAFEKLGVNMQIVRHGEYKSAVEPYFRKDMSDKSREQLLAFLNSIWDHMLAEIFEKRGVSVEELNRLADELSIKLPEDALKAGLIDGIMYQDELIEEIRTLSEIDPDKKVRIVELSKYIKVPKTRSKKGLAKDKIAIVYATGEIGFGKGNENSIGDYTFAKALRSARKDSTVKAIVLRVNSPGGSAMVSEHIWREIQLAADVKPLIASMGNLAASGGYYIVTPAHTIVCNPTSLTGSIGVFGTIPNLEKLFNEKLGLTFDVAKTNDYSDFGSLYRPLKPAERAYLLATIESTYKTFLKRVGDGRNLEVAYVDEIAGGRIWSGLMAKEIGLVDEIGGLKTAITIAADKAGLDHYRTIALPKFEDPLEKILKSLSADLSANFKNKKWGTYGRFLEELDKVLNSSGIQARMPFSIEIY